MARAAAAAAVLAALGGAVPAALARYVGWPLPRQLTGAHVRALVTAPLTDTALVKILACAVWAAWAFFTLCVAAEIAARLQGRPCPRLPVISGAQALAAALVSAIIVTASPGAASTSAPRAGAPVPVAASYRPAWAVPPAGSARAGGAVAGGRAPVRSPAQAAPGPAHARYRVEAGDNLWDIAARHLGDGERWHEIFALNRGRPQPGGGALTDPRLIYPGWVLLLPAHPAGQTHLAPAGHRPAHAQHRPGDQPRLHPRPSHRVPGHHNTRTGRSARPPLPSPPAPQRPVGIHLPRGGLLGITAAAAISAALVAWRLHRRRAAALAWPADAERAETLPDAVIRLRCAYLRSTAANDPGAGGEPRPAGDTACPALGGPGSGEDDGDGLDEFGAPAGLPAPPPGGPAGERSGPLPSPAPPAGPPHAWDRPGPAAPGGPVSPPAGEEPVPPGPPLPPGTVTFGVLEGKEIPLSALTRGGLGLTGPGAAGTARALLIGLLAAPAPRAKGPAAQVVIPGADAQQLLGNYPVAPVPGVTPGLPDGLIIAPGLSAALDQIEVQLVHRLRLLGTGDDPSVPATPGTGGEPVPPLALIATVDQVSAARVRAVVAAGAQAGLVVFVLGDWPAGITCQIGAGGDILAATSAGLTGAQAFHLPAQDTASLLGLLRGAQGHLTASTPQAPGQRHDHQPGTPAPAPGLSRNKPGDTPGGGHRGSGAPPRPAGQHARHEPAGPPPSTFPATPRKDQRPAATGEARSLPPPEPIPGSYSAVTRPVQIAVLGPLRITAEGDEIRGGLRKARELLAYLALHPGGVTGAALSEALWPDAAPRYGTAQRHLALRKAREMLRTATGLSQPMFITLASERYRLDPALIDADIWQFDAALDQARATADLARQLEILRRAVMLYRGPVADGAGYEWAERYAEPARRRAVDALARLAELQQPTDAEQALTTLETALAHDPYNEALYQRIMHLQVGLGRPDAARRTLALLQARLAELGLSPGPAARQAASSARPGHPRGQRPL
jgi:DNA-binding SARP family transcriptional activator